MLVAWTVLTPAYRSPDEPQHVSAVLGLLHGEGWPRPGEADIDTGVLRSAVLSGFLTRPDQPTSRGNTLPSTHRGTGRTQPPLFSAVPPTAPAQRLSYAELTTGDPSGQTNQMTQHPPLYYLAEAGVLAVSGADGWRYDRTLALLRLGSVALVGWLPLLAYFLVRRLTRSAAVGSVAAFLPLGVPQLAAVGSSVNNDALVVLLGAVLVTLLGYLLTGARRPVLLGAVAVVLGLALLTKGTMLSAVPVVAVAVPIGLRRSGCGWVRAAGGGLVVLAGAFVVGGWWWAVNLLRYGTLQPNGFGVDRDRSAGSLDVVDFGRHFGELLSVSTWGNFGWLEVPLPGTLTTVLSVGTLGLAALGLFGRRTRPALPVLASLPLFTLAALFAAVYSTHLLDGRFNGVQGRYLFGTVLVVLAAVAVGASMLAGLIRLPQRWLVPVAALGSGALAVFGAVVAFRGFYVDVGVSVAQAWDVLTAWAPWPGPVVVSIAGTAAAALVLGPVLAVAWSIRAGHDPDRGSVPTPA